MPEQDGTLSELRGLRVLAIDDQGYARDLLRAIFRHAGAEVRLAESVRAGLAAVETDPPDVVICDLAMPEEDGFAFIRQLRRLSAPVSAIPVIALTAFGRPEDRQIALSAGFDEYLKKPVDPETLTMTVSAFRRPNK
jgi:CheY-like chemotaxis protein